MESPEKSSSALSLIPEEHPKMNPTTSKSCESLYSISSKGSANVIYRNKTNTGTNNKSDCFPATRQPAIIPATNEVRQRVLSARRLRMKTYQNQLADAQQTIAELAHENRILRTLHKRQDSALSKYESNNAELPQLLHSHAEELRVWQSKYRNLQAVNKELEQKLKQKEALILSLSDQNKYYIQLNKDKNLEDRQRLTEKLNALETRIQEKDNDLKMLARKMQLETKQSKLHIQMEQKRSKDLLIKLEKARLELSGYRKLDEFQLQEKVNMNSRRPKNNNDSPKAEREIDKYSLSNITEAETGEVIEAPASQRSTHSYNEMLQRTTRSIKKTTTKALSTLSSSTIVLQQNPKQQAPTSKTFAVLRRIDQGDGDACNTHDGCKSSNYLNTSLMQRQQLNLSSMTHRQEEEFQHDYEDEEYENDVAELKKTEENNDLTDNRPSASDEDEVADYVSSAEGLNDETDDDSVADKHGYVPQSKKIAHYNPDKQTHFREDISNIRKQITDDFKDREAFLDTFCRQATNGVLRDENETKRNSVPNNRKHKLLAALKAIDDNKSQD